MAFSARLSKTLFMLLEYFVTEWCGFMSLIEEVISSGDLLEFLEHMDGVLEVYGGTRRNERVVAVALQNSLFPLCSLYDPAYAKHLRGSIIVLRNVNVPPEFYQKIFPPGKWSTELDLLFLNVPTVFGHPLEGALNFHVEVEVSERADIGTELTRLTKIREYFEDKGVWINPILVCRGYKRWDRSFKIPIIDIADLEKIIEFNPPTSLDDIPGASYDWATSSIQILKYVAERGKIRSVRELWDNRESLRQMNHDKFLREGRLAHNDHEDFNYSFMPRINQILDKMCRKGLLNRNPNGEYELTVDGRDVLATYLSFGGAK
jgi:hypothetical protein